MRNETVPHNSTFLTKVNPFGGVDGAVDHIAVGWRRVVGDTGQSPRASGVPRDHPGVPIPGSADHLPARARAGPDHPRSRDVVWLPALGLRPLRANFRTRTRVCTGHRKAVDCPCPVVLRDARMSVERRTAGQRPTLALPLAWRYLVDVPTARCKPSMVRSLLISLSGWASHRTIRSGCPRSRTGRVLYS